HLKEARPVVSHGFGGIAANEGVHSPDIEQRRSADHLADVLDSARRFVRIRRKWVGVIAESADVHTGPSHDGAHVISLRSSEVGDIDVRDASVAPLGLADRPAHQLDAIITGLPGELRDLREGEFREDRTDKAELHDLLLPWWRHVSWVT